MKNFKYYVLMLLLAGTFAFAQKTPAPSSKPDMELTKDEATLRIEEFQRVVKNLEERLAELNSKHTTLKGDLEKVNKQIKDCQDELNALVGASDADIAAFRQRLGVLEGKVREMQRLSEDKLLERQDDVRKLEEELNELRGNKIALLPEFYNKIIALAKDIRGLYREKKVTTYTVGTWAENRDCLWNIAGKIEIYGDFFMWPKIWQANTSQIRNPDIIFPGQVLQIPVKGPKTSDEIKAERKYWRNKKAAQTDATAVPGGTN